MQPLAARRGDASATRSGAVLVGALLGALAPGQVSARGVPWYRQLLASSCDAKRRVQRVMITAGSYDIVRPDPPDAVAQWRWGCSPWRARTRARLGLACRSCSQSDPRTSSSTPMAARGPRRGRPRRRRRTPRAARATQTSRQWAGRRRRAASLARAHGTARTVTPHRSPPTSRPGHHTL